MLNSGYVPNLGTEFKFETEPEFNISDMRRTYHVNG
jgi:hypothetical protein